MLVGTSEQPEFKAVLEHIRERCPGVVLIDMARLPDGGGGGAGDDRPGVEVGVDEDAYVLFTSGTESRPKGVRMSHRAALNTVEEINHMLALGPSDRVFALSNLYFDLSIFDIFGTLAVGACVVVPHTNAVSQASLWAAFAWQQGVTIWNSVPQLLRTALSVWGKEVNPTLRACMVSGDKVPVDLPAKVTAMTAKPARLIALGGATEAGIWSNCYETQRNVDYALFGRVPYGHALPGQTMYVLDSQQRQCPLNVVGTIYIGGGSLATGYWHDEERTAKTFAPHPVTGERLYYTGDMGRYIDPSLTIDIMGRVSQMETSGWIKVRGVRLNPDMIVSALLTNPDVVNATVCRINLNKLQDELVAVVVPRLELELTADDLTELMLQPTEASIVYPTLRSRFPPNMLPSWVLYVEDVPLSSNGKVDIKTVTQWVIQAFHNAQQDSASTAIEPSSAMEIQLCSVMRNHLQLPASMTMSVNERYANWGLNSMNGIYLVEKLRLASITVSIDQVMQMGTIRALSKVARWNQTVNPAQGYRVPLTEYQQRLGLLAPHRSVVIDNVEHGHQLVANLRSRLSLLRARWVARPEASSAAGAAAAWVVHVEVPPEDAAEDQLSSAESGPLAVFEYNAGTRVMKISASPALLDGTAWSMLLGCVRSHQSIVDFDTASLAESLRNPGEQPKGKKRATAGGNEAAGREADDDNDGDADSDDGLDQDDDLELKAGVLWPCWLAEENIPSVLSVQTHQMPPQATFEVDPDVATDKTRVQFPLDLALAAAGQAPLDVAWAQVSGVLKGMAPLSRAQYALFTTTQVGPAVGPTVSMHESVIPGPAGASVLVTLLPRYVNTPELYSLFHVHPCAVEVLVMPEMDRTLTGLTEVCMPSEERKKNERKKKCIVAGP